MMSEYIVTWTIDAEAGSPREAAQLVFSHNFNSATTATVFQVLDTDGNITRVDLMEDE